MPAPVATRQMFVKDKDGFAPTEISVSIPIKREDGLHVCSVVFSNPSKYSASINGADGLNALEGALAYIDSICASSEDPEFHWQANGGRHKGRPA